MYSRLWIIAFAADLDATARARAIAALDAACGRLPDVRTRLSAPTLPGAYNGGDHILRLGFEDAATCAAALATPEGRALEACLADRSEVCGVERVGYGEGRSGGAAGDPGLYRVALFSATRAPTPERLAAFDAETAAMPAAITAIQRWRLAEAEQAQGSARWTHVWEQEYRALSDLTGAYMMHPAHWARVERWFDPECPEHLVDPHLVHTFCGLDRPVILWTAPA